MGRKESFSEKVYKVVAKIPKGRVVTYGWIAKRLGKPKAARAVGNALHRNLNSKKIPCHRVVDRNGRIAKNYAFGGWKEQKRRLEVEGVKFKDKKHLDLGKFLVF